MKHVLAVAATLAFACFVCSAPAVAEESSPAPEIKKWDALVGHWSNEEQHRNSEKDPWVKVNSEWDVRFAPGGFFVETPGKITLSDGEVSWIQVWGYDPSKKAAFSRWFDSKGAQGSLTFQWDGRSLKVQGTDLLADGSESSVGCTWTNSEDFKSSEGVCERLTNGKWWAFRKVKGRKTE